MNSCRAQVMTVAALLDLGADKDGLLKTLDELQVPGYEIKIGRTVKNGIDACNFDVILEDGHVHKTGKTRYRGKKTL